MKISYIIAIYKDIEALSLIMDALLIQTRPPDEIIIAQDGNDESVIKFIKTIQADKSKIIHTTQKDIGWRKNKSLNNAVRASSGDYLIFNDGDVVPYPTLVESYYILAKKNSVLCGRRVNLGEKFSHKLRTREISVIDFVKQYYKNYTQLKNDGVKNYEEGIYLSPKNIFWMLFNKLFRQKQNLLGCCFGIFRQDLDKINGFDEDFIKPSTGCDTDIQRRLTHYGIKFDSCRNSANVLHLFHKEKYDKQNSIDNLKLMETKKNIYKCKNGLKKI